MGEVNFCSFSEEQQQHYHIGTQIFKRHKPDENFKIHQKILYAKKFQRKVFPTLAAFPLWLSLENGEKAVSFYCYEVLLANLPVFEA